VQQNYFLLTESALRNAEHKRNNSRKTFGNNKETGCKQ